VFSHVGGWRSVDLVESENEFDTPWSEAVRLKLRAPARCGNFSPSEAGIMR